MIKSNLEKVVAVTSIYFNYYQLDAERFGSHPEYGINVLPGDISRFPTLPYSAVAYGADSIDGDELVMFAEFSGPRSSQVLVRTQPPSQKATSELLNYFKDIGISIEDVNPDRLLGDVKETPVSFDKDGNSVVYFAAKEEPLNPVEHEHGVIQLTIEGSKIWGIGVVASWQLWQWQFSEDKGETWQNVSNLFRGGLSAHRVYITKNLPNWPWTALDQKIKQVEGNYFITRPPYIEILELACEWANSLKTIEEIVAAITTSLNKSGRFKYDYSNNYTSPFVNFFDCTRFVDRLYGKFGRGPNVNCIDCSYMVISLCNVLGCDLRPVMIKQPGESMSPFMTNPIVPIGIDTEGKIEEFSLHQFAVLLTDDNIANATVYDACLRYDLETFEIVMKDSDQWLKIIENPPPPDDRQPIGLPLGSDIFSQGYMAILARRSKAPSQKNLTSHDGEALIFGVGAFQIY